jgi:hypothetical protein
MTTVEQKAGLHNLTPIDLHAATLRPRRAIQPPSRRRLSPQSGVIQERRAGIRARMTRMWAAGFAAMLVGVSACSSPDITAQTSEGPNTTVASASVLPTSASQASQELSSGLTKQQQYLAKYHQLLPQDKSSDDAILAAAKKYCDQSAPSTSADATSQLIAFWQQLNCPK